MLGQLSLFDFGEPKINLAELEIKPYSESKPPSKFIQRELKKIQSKENSTKWLLKSAFHKEVRRCDVERGYHYAMLIKELLGASTLRSYCRMIIFEETRNIKLYEKMYTERGREIEHAIALIASKNKWHLDGRSEAYPVYLQAHANILKSDKRFSAIDCKKIIQQGSLLERYELFFGEHYERIDEDIKIVKAMLQSELKQSSNVYARILGSRKLDFYEIKVGHEILVGMFDTHSCDKFEYEKPTRLVFPEYAPYVYDNHTFQGKALLRKHWNDIRFGKELPYPIDIRWSGLIRGVAWRELGRGRNLIETNWEDIKMDDNEYWEQIRLLDVFFYKKFLDDIGVEK